MKTSTTAKIAYVTLGLKGACIAAIVVCAALLRDDPAALEAVCAALGQALMATALGGGAAVVGYGGRHFGARAMTSAERDYESRVVEP